MFGLGKLQKRIGVKLFFLLTTLFLLALAPLIYTVFTTVTYFGNYTVNINRTQIKEQSYSYLRTIAREQARICESFFSRALVVSSLMAAQARDVYENIDYYAGLPGERVILAKNDENQIFYTPLGEDVVTAYWGGHQISPPVSQELLALSRLDPVLRRGRLEVPESHATHMITLSGIGRYLTEDEKAQEAIYNLPPVEVFDLRDGEPVAMFTGEKEPQERTRWTRVYKDDVIDGLMITASSPVFDDNGSLRAITGVDVPLNKILSELAGWKELGTKGNALFFFIMDSDGRLIAFPLDYLALFGLEVDWSLLQNSDDIFDYKLSDSTIGDIAGLLPELVQNDSGTFEVSLGEDVYIFTQQYIPGLEWHLVLVNNEGQLTSSISRTEEALGGTIHTLINKFVISALLILLFVIFAVFLAVNHFVAPLKKLSEAALRVGAGDLATRCKLGRNDELGSLAESFNGMVERLETAEKLQRRYAKQLEVEVEEQTRDLRRKNYELHDVIAELNVESERRKRAVEALRQSEEQIRTAMGASLAGLCIVQNMGFQYINPQFTRIFGYESDEVVGDFDPLETIAPEARERIRKQWLGIISGSVGKPLSIQGLRKDGSRFEALVGGDLTVWQGKPAVVATFMDISDQKKAEAQLLESRNMLQASLKEKEVLMREIYHRTKNNMLVIISMLNLQAMDIEDEHVRELFKETENRIRAMSIAHEKLYQSQNLSEVDLSVYLQDMVRTLVETMVYGDRVSVAVDCVEGIRVSLDAIVPLGLAVNEIVTNSIKHAFPDYGRGRICIKVHQEEDGMVVMEVGDDGIGLPAGIDVAKSPSLGLQITVNLIEKQLQGSLEVDRTNGTMYIVRFGETAKPKRI